MSIGMVDDPKGGASVSLDPISAQVRPPTTADAPNEDANLVSLFTEEEQKKIVQTVIRDVDSDIDSREPRMKRLKEYQGLYASVMKAKAFPFKNAANVNLPILTYPLLQVQGRLYDMVWPADGKIMYSHPTNSSDMDRANITEMFGNSYLRHKMPEMAQGIDDSLHQVCCYGSSFRRTYWNSYEGRACSDWIPIEDFVVAAGQRSQDPSMRDVQRYTMILHLSYYDIESYGDKGIYSNTDKVKAVEPDSDKHDSEFKQQIAKIDGTADSDDTTTEDKPRLVYEQHRMWRMPKAPDVHPAFDGKPHPVVITVEDQSMQVLRFVIREEPDPDDHSRFQKANAAYEAHDVIDFL